MVFLVVISTGILLAIARAEPEPIPTQAPSSSNSNECILREFESHCVLDILQEHIEATAIVNKCHVPLDVTFRVVYRYGNGTAQRWQYTFVTSNQNERVLIPGLILPPAPQAPVYLYVRVPQQDFDLQEINLLSIEASFVAVLENDEWEEVEFLKDDVVLTQMEECNNFDVSNNSQQLFWILGGVFLCSLVIGTGVLVFCCWQRRRKMALDQLALVHSLENGLPGAQPYQMPTNGELEGPVVSTISGQTEPNPEVMAATETRTSSTSMPSVVAAAAINIKNGNAKAFKFGRLKEESLGELSDKAAVSYDRTTVISNPVLFEKQIVSKRSLQNSEDVKLGCKILRNQVIEKPNNKIENRIETISTVGSPVINNNNEDIMDMRNDNETSKQNVNDSHPLANESVKTIDNTKVLGARPKTTFQSSSKQHIDSRLK